MLKWAFVGTEQHRVRMDEWAQCRGRRGGRRGLGQQRHGRHYAAARHRACASTSSTGCRLDLDAGLYQHQRSGTNWRCRWPLSSAYAASMPALRHWRRAAWSTCRRDAGVVMATTTTCVEQQRAPPDARTAGTQGLAGWWPRVSHSGPSARGRRAGASTPVAAGGGVVLDIAVQHNADSLAFPARRVSGRGDGDEQQQRHGPRRRGPGDVALAVPSGLCAFTTGGFNTPHALGTGSRSWATRPAWRRAACWNQAPAASWSGAAPTATCRCGSTTTTCICAACASCTRRSPARTATWPARRGTAQVAHAVLAVRARSGRRAGSTTHEAAARRRLREPGLDRGHVDDAGRFYERHCARPAGGFFHYLRDDGSV